MKFSLFLHMERYDNEISDTQLFNEMTELVQMAEAGGFETAWIGEHHAMGFTIAPNPLVNIAYLANKTSTIRLGTGTLIAPFWHPIKAAGEAGLVDVMTNGRLDLGLARGAYGFEYERLFPGLDAMSAGARLREMIPALQGLFAGDYAHDGEFWQFPTSTAVPRPIQQPYPPIWVAARDPNSHQYAVSNGCNVQVTSLASGDEEVKSLMEKFRTACEMNPDVPRPQIMMLMHTFVGETEEEIQEGALNVSKFYCYFAKWFKNVQPIEQGVIQALTDEEMAEYPQYAPELMRKNTVIGTPAEVIARLKSYEAMGYDQYSYWIDCHMTFEQKKQSLQRFIDQVVPAFA
ncbi:LLM class flavin-dependent oxidoreductase [Leeia sp. TBRC 13508]|uniref:LLM class flavin-dependent oxidoreductase n=1 Tax=Leeia speluncae TaxID=2884804 RepID=A0ABS8D4V8_9NEIS|nr:LLM class flavin-dependent oxidoreductase [Leeia speluncae]MCB6183028.1 LLM class flavin-dependent oxidoreductase [Leeia speluncae]